MSDVVGNSGKNPSTDADVSLLSFKTQIPVQRFYVVIAIALLLPIFLFLHNSKRRSRMNTRCPDQIEKVSKTIMDSGSKEPGTPTSGIESEGVSCLVSTQPLKKRNWWDPWLIEFRELEAATNNFSKEKVIGEGVNGVVYKAYLQDGSLVAVKNLKGSREQANKKFMAEVEVTGNLPHNSIVKLIGYCAEGAKRSLVYESVNNGNLKKWLHDDTGRTSPLTWDIRMKIAIRIAKALSYLHQGLPTKVVHGTSTASGDG